MVALSCISSSSAILSLSANLSLRKKMYTAPKQLFYTASWKQKMYTASQLFYTTSRELKMYTASRQGFSIQHLSSHQVLSGCHTNTEEAYLFWLPPHYDLWHWFNWGHLLFFFFEIGHYQWLFIAASMSEFITFIPGPWVTTGDVQEFRAMFVGHERSLSHLYETRIQSYVGRSRILYEMRSHDSQWLTALILKTGCGEPLQKQFSILLFQVFESKFDCVPMELLNVGPEVDMSHLLYLSHRHPE